MSGISTHVLDTTLGKPASGLKVSLAREDVQGDFRSIADRITDPQGRVADFLGSTHLAAGTYRLRFQTEPYLQFTHGVGFYPHVEIFFRVADAGAHYHVPLLLSPFGYSTYRGS
jgi:5-hydroxyisourate hydrolase